MAVGTERGCGGGLRSGAGAAASLYAGGRGSELLWCVCFGAGGALGACSVRAASVREGGRRARRLGSAEERGCAHLPTVDLCGDPFVPPPLPGTNQPDPCRLLRLARRCCRRKLHGEVQTGRRRPEALGKGTGTTDREACRLQFVTAGICTSLGNFPQRLKTEGTHFCMKCLYNVSPRRGFKLCLEA